MKFDSKQELTWNSNYFDVARNELNIAIQSAVAEMIEKDMNNASITLKIDISTESTMTNDATAQMGTRPSMNIEIGAKVTKVLSQKEDTKLDVIGKYDRELVVDDLGRYYAVSHDEASGQLSMFNSWDEYHETAVS